LQLAACSLQVLVLMPLFYCHEKEKCWLNIYLIRKMFTVSPESNLLFFTEREELSKPMSIIIKAAQPDNPR
jgi:hypothetical protein